MTTNDNKKNPPKLGTFAPGVSVRRPAEAPKSPAVGLGPLTARAPAEADPNATVTVYGVYRAGDQYLPCEVNLPFKDLKPLIYKGIRSTFGSYVMAFNKVVSEMNRRFIMPSLRTGIPPQPPTKGAAEDL